MGMFETTAGVWALAYIFKTVSPAPPPEPIGSNICGDGKGGAVVYYNKHANHIDTKRPSTFSVHETPPGYRPKVTKIVKTNDHSRAAQAFAHFCKDKDIRHILDLDPPRPAPQHIPRTQSHKGRRGPLGW